MNTQAFRLGRLAAADPARLAAMMKGQDETVGAEDAGRDVARRDHRASQRAC